MNCRMGHSGKQLWQRMCRNFQNEPKSSSKVERMGALIFACMLHPSTSYRAGWSYLIHGWLDFHPSTSSGSSNQASLCIQPKIRCARLFYLTRWLWAWLISCLLIVTCFKDIYTRSRVIGVHNFAKGLQLGSLVLVADLSGFVVADQGVDIACLLQEADGAGLGEGFVADFSLG